MLLAAIWTLKWENNIHKVRENAGKYTHEIYATVVCAIQWEWTFLQRIKKNTGDAFTGV